MSAQEFEVVYLRLYKKDGIRWGQPWFSVFDKFFYDVDDFYADPALRAQVSGSIDEAELRLRAAVTFDQLAQLAV